MPCFNPLEGYRSKTVTKNGKRKIVFNTQDGFVDLPVKVPCGQCIGCRLERSRQWAIRCVHEASLYSSNCFITLTYNDHNLPVGGSLVLDDFQRFMKRLRKKFGDGIRFFHCGEYGEKFKRPHYHACIFNLDFPDKKLVYKRLGHNIYSSVILSELWPYGFHEIGDVTFESAAYVARYIMKKVNGKKADMHYTSIDYNTGEYVDLKPEYVTMSRRPGLGSKWFDKFSTDVFPSDFIVLNEKKMRPPKYYDYLYDIAMPDDLRKVKVRREKYAKLFDKNNTSDRLKVREAVLASKIKNLKRGYEND